MGDVADDAEAAYWQDKEYDDDRLYNLMWMDAYGEEHFIPNMETSYIMNCISHLEEIERYNKEAWLSAFQDELVSRSKFPL